MSIANFVVGMAALALFVAVLLSMLVDQPPTPIGTMMIPAIAVAFFLGYLVRQMWAPSVTLEPYEFVYRSTGWTRRIPRASITGMTIEKGWMEGQGIFRWWYPRLGLTDGRSIWLKDMKGVLLGGIDEPDRYSDNLVRMDAAVQAWIAETHPSIID